MEIFITGIAGFIGSAIAKLLVNQSQFDEIGGLLLPGENTSLIDEFSSDLTLETASLLDFETIRDVIKKHQPNIIIHLAALSTVRQSFERALFFQEVNYLGTVNLVEAAIGLETQFKVFVFASTADVYGRQTIREPFSESTIPFPTNPYAVSKWAAEKYLEMAGMSREFPYIVLRPANTYGRSHTFSFVIEYLISSMLKGENPQLGTPGAIRDFIHRDDHVEAYMTALNANRHGTYNVGSGLERSLLDIAQFIAEEVGFEGTIHQGFPENYPLRPTAVDYVSLDITKITKELGWKPKIGLEEGIQRTIKEISQNLRQ